MTKSIIVVTICYKLLCHSSRFLISNFLASTDINVFGRTYLFAMLLLIGLALFLHPGCFCLVYVTRFVKRAFVNASDFATLMWLKFSVKSSY